MLSKSKLIDRIKNNLAIPVDKEQLEEIVEQTFDQIVNALSNGEEVYLPKFGKFYIRYVKGRVIKNTGIPWLQNQVFSVRDSMKIGFKASTNINKKVQESVYKFLEQNNLSVPKLETVSKDDV